MYAYIERVTIRHDKLKYRQHLTYNFIKMRLLRGIQQNGKKRKKKKRIEWNLRITKTAYRNYSKNES